MLNYKELNEKINIYIKEHDRCFYLKNLESTLLLLRECNDIIDPYNKLKTNRIRIHYTDKVDGLTSIKLVKEYLHLLNPEYEKIFAECLTNGTFGFNDLINDSDIDYANINCAGIKDNHRFFNVGFEGNVIDSKILVHEFFHNLNTSDYYSRDLFTEAISIYNENKLLDYLLSKGYSKDDIAKAKLERYLSFYQLLKPLYYETLILNIGSKIDSYDYDFLMKYQDALLFPMISEETWEEKLKITLTRLQAYNEQDSDQKKFSPNISYRYFIGTILSCYLLTHEDENTHKRVLQLNDKLSSAISFAECFDILKINLNDISHQDLVASVNNYYDKIITPSILTEEKKIIKRKIRS